MSIAQAILEEFEHEAKTTRRFLERIPQDKLMWRPHEKSHTVGELGLHIANLPAFVLQFALVESSPVPTESEVNRQPATVHEILSSHEKTIETVRKILPTLSDAHLMTNWSAMV